MSSYNYSIVADTLNGLANFSELSNTIEASTIVPSLHNITSNGDIMTVSFAATLSAEDKNVLDTLIGIHDGSSTPETSIAQEVKIVEEVASAPFASKTLSTGQKLFKRVHGVQESIAANSTAAIRLVLPYTQAKINGLEIIGASLGDTANFKVYDNAVGTISGYPDILLNQFGFNVCMRKDFHIEESAYDADVILGMVLELEFTNSTSNSVTIGANFILHEVV